MARGKRTEKEAISSEVAIMNSLKTMIVSDDSMELSDILEADDVIVENPENYVSSQSSLLDVAVSNRANAGIITFGRILELNGLQGCGKSLICAHMIADVQKEGGIAIWIDTERSLNDDNKAFFKAVGVDFKRVLLVHSNCVEDIFAKIEELVIKIRQDDKNRKAIFIVDSLTAAKMRAELESDVRKAKDGYGMQKPAYLSAQLSRLTSLIAKQKIAMVFTQQLRVNPMAMPFGDKYVTSGGLALPFYASVRIRLAIAGQIKMDINGEKITVGVKVQAKVLKNRLGPPHRVVEFDIYFDRGIDDETSWLEVLKKKDIISGTGAKYIFIDSEGVEHIFKRSTWSEFIEENPATFEEIYLRLTESMVLSYKTNDINTLDGSASVTTEDEE